MRNSGKTTRKLVKMLTTLLEDKHNQHFVYATPRGIKETERVAHIFKGLLDTLGIASTIQGSTISYEAKWDGEVLFTRKIRFITREQYLNDEFVVHAVLFADC